MGSIGILGAGTWGCALGCLLANNGHDVSIWSSSEDRAARLQTSHVHPNLPEATMPDSLEFTANIAAAAQGKDLIIVATSSPALRSAIAAARPHVSQGQVMAVATKGIESATLLTMSEVAEDEMDGLDVRMVALCGPTHAEEVSRGLPSAIVAASQHPEAADAVQRFIACDTMRAYTQSDIRGVELSAALKNIIALACGIAGGLGYGDNTRAALITRGMEEIKRLGLARGCSERTFDGLAGIGDLVVTATSLHSRNNRAGMLIGAGKTAEQACEEVGMVVEGINALPAACRMAALLEVDMPIVAAVDAVVAGTLPPKDAVLGLMRRQPRSEVPWSASLRTPDPKQRDQTRGNPSNSTVAVPGENAGIDTIAPNANAERTPLMKRVITYGTYDLLHYGHINLLRRAKEYGDYLIVALSTDEFNWDQKRKKCYFSYEQRKALLEAIRYVDLVIPEESWDQKRADAHEYHIDTFVIGDDWEGEFDFLEEEGVEVVYLSRTPEISTTQIKRDLNEKDMTEKE